MRNIQSEKKEVYREKMRGKKLIYNLIPKRLFSHLIEIDFTEITTQDDKSVVVSENNINPDSKTNIVVESSVMVGNKDVVGDVNKFESPTTPVIVTPELREMNQENEVFEMKEKSEVDLVSQCLFTGAKLGLFTTQENLIVLVTDFVDFTKYCNNKESGDIIDVLNMYYTSFDRISKKCGMEKYQTIGDSYICLNNWDYKNATNEDFIKAVDCVVEMLKFINKSTKMKMRIGLAKGDGTWCLLGKRRISLSLFGPAVRKASLLEQSSKDGRALVCKEIVEITKSLYIYDDEEKVFRSEDVGVTRARFLIKKKDIVLKEKELVNSKRLFNSTTDLDKRKNVMKRRNSLKNVFKSLSHLTEAKIVSKDLNSSSSSSLSRRSSSEKKKKKKRRKKMKKKEKKKTFLESIIWFLDSLFVIYWNNVPGFFRFKMDMHFNDLLISILLCLFVIPLMNILLYIRIGSFMYLDYSFMTFGIACGSILAVQFVLFMLLLLLYYIALHFQLGKMKKTLVVGAGILNTFVLAPIIPHVIVFLPVKDIIVELYYFCTFFFVINFMFSPFQPYVKSIFGGFYLICFVVNVNLAFYDYSITVDNWFSMVGSLMFQLFYLCVIGLLLLITAGFSERLGINFFKNAETLTKLTRKLKKEKNQNDFLLLSVLPLHIYKMIKNNEKFQYKSETGAVAFVKIRGYNELLRRFHERKRSNYGEDVESKIKDLLIFLNQLYCSFEKLILNYSYCSKIKSLENIFIIEARPKFVLNELDVKKTIKQLFELIFNFFETFRRINSFRQIEDVNIVGGVSFGHYTSGIIGKRKNRKFHFDCIGTPLNMAARLSQMGESEKIHIDSAVFELMMFSKKYTFVKKKSKVKGVGENVITYITTKKNTFVK